MLTVPIETVARALGRDVNEIEVEMELMGYIPSPLIGETMYEMLAERLGVGPEPEPPTEPASGEKPATAAAGVVTSFMPASHRAKTGVLNPRTQRCHLPPGA